MLLRIVCLLVVTAALTGDGLVPSTVSAETLTAGAAKIDITDYDYGPANDPLYVKALVVKSASTTAVFITVDAVAIGEIGPIKNNYLPSVRRQLQESLGIAPEAVIINASHCHGVVCADVDARTVQAVTEAMQAMVPVKVGVGRGHEDRVMENRRLKLKSGREADVRHAYSLPPDDAVAEVGPVDPDIGLLRIDRVSGGTLAVLYNFACHPIQGVPGGGNTADMIGYASKVLETGFGDGMLALFFQGCGGDINPVQYKDVGNPRDAAPLGHQLGLSALEAARAITCTAEVPFQLISASLDLPRADNAEKIAALEAEQLKLLNSLRGTTLNLKTFLALTARHGLDDEFPTGYSHRYLHEASRGRDHLQRFDNENRRNLEQYRKNIFVMEELTRLQANLALLRKHQARNVAAGSRTLTVELTTLRLGDFVLTTFPGELTVRIGLNIKQASPFPQTFVAGYTNGYIYYAPTTEQLLNVGGAQEDSDCLVAPEWQPIYEAKVQELLAKLRR